MVSFQWKYASVYPESLVKIARAEIVWKDFKQFQPVSFTHQR